MPIPDIIVLKQQVFACLFESSKPLTKWEQGFCEDISEKLDCGYSLSDRQAEILERIYEEKT